MRYAEYLPAGGTIGFAAPSFGCSIEPYRSAFDAGLAVWEKMGYGTLIGPNCYESSGIGISNTPEKCAEELMDLYTTDACDILLSCGGGELMCEDLDHMDWERIRQAAPKWYMGYSDNTNFIFLLTTLCDTAAIYGPNAPAFGMKPWHPSLKDALHILDGSSSRIEGYALYEKESLKDKEHPLEPYHVTEPVVRRAWPEGASHMEGRLVGGCLDCLTNLCGTRFDHVKEFNAKYGQEGIVWFLEACDLTVLGIRRAIWQLKNAGWFDCASGFLIGRPYCHGQEIMGLDQYHAVLDMLEDLHVPVFLDLDIGHIPPMMPLISGSYIRAELEGNTFRAEMLQRE